LINLGLTSTLRYPLAEHCNTGIWRVSATINNTTSSVQVRVSRAVTSLFHLNAIFQRYLLRTDTTLYGIIKIADNKKKPIIGRGKIAIGQMTEKEFQSKMRNQPKEEQWKNDEWRQWEFQSFEIAGRIEFNYDLLSLFRVDITKAIAVQVYIEVTDHDTAQKRVIHHIIPVFTRDVIYDIHPLKF
jgi:hypothetical protein